MRPTPLNASRLVCVCLGALLVSACATTYHRAESLAEEGRFLEAAALYERVARQEPKNREVAEKLQRARWRALEQLLGQARAHRRKEEHPSANAKLQTFLQYRAAWNTKLNGALESSLEDEVDAVHAWLKKTVAKPAQAGLALTAERSLGGVQSLLAHPELAAVRSEMEAEVASSGRAGCARIRDLKVTSPVHWTELVHRYCSHFQQEAPAPAVLPETVSSLGFGGAVRGISPTQRELLESGVTRAFEASPWFSPRSPRRVEVGFTGEVVTRRHQESVQLSAPWTEQVPYVVEETRTVTEQEAYTEYETYMDRESYFDTETYTYPCGQRTCTGTRTVTRYRNVPRQRSVTKYRPVQRQVKEQVTRYRSEAREFIYVATKVSVAYRLALFLKAAFEPERSAFSAALSDQLSEWDYEHDASFPAAGVYPTRSKLPPPQRWLEVQLEGYQREVHSQLFKRWRESFCLAPSYSVDEAARCARAGLELPGPAVQALAPIFAEDAARVHTLFRGPTSAAPPAAFAPRPSVALDARKLSAER